jgi:hypothetical protein
MNHKLRAETVVGTFCLETVEKLDTQLFLSVEKNKQKTVREILF